MADSENQSGKDGNDSEINTFLSPEEFEKRLLAAASNQPGNTDLHSLVQTLGAALRSSTTEPAASTKSNPERIRTPETLDDRLARFRRHYDESYEQYCGNLESLGDPAGLLPAIHKFRRDHVSWAATEGNEHDRYNRIEDGKPEVKGVMMILPRNKRIGNNLVLETDPREGVNMVRIGDFDTSKTWAAVTMNVALGIMYRRANYPEQMRKTIEEHYTQSFQDTGTQMAVLDMIIGKSLMTVAGNHLYKAGVIIRTDQVRPGFSTPDHIVRACRDKRIILPLYRELEDLIVEPAASETEKSIRQSFCIELIALYLISIMEMANKGESRSELNYSALAVETMRKLELTSQNDRYK